jgi:hypothetical protein
MTEETTRTETESTERTARTKTAEATEKVVEQAIDLGRVWARYGLSIGKMALETSAQSLKTTAGLLGTIAEAFETKDEPTAGEPSSERSAA